MTLSKERIEAALDARNVDVEALKREVSHGLRFGKLVTKIDPNYDLTDIEVISWATIDHLSANGYLKDQSATIDALAGALKLYAYGDWQEGGGVYNTESHEVDFGDKARAALALAGKGE